MKCFARSLRIYYSQGQFSPHLQANVFEEASLPGPSKAVTNTQQLLIWEKGLHFQCAIEGVLL